MSDRGLEVYEIGRIAVVPGSKPYLFYLTLDPASLTAVSVLEKITDEFAKEGIPILQVKTSTIGWGKPVKIIIIADFKDKEKLAEELAEKFKRTIFVKSVKLSQPITEGVVIDVFSFPLTFLGTRAVIFREPVYKGFIIGGWKHFGVPYAILLYSIGYEAGRLAYAEHAKVVNKPETIKFAEAVFQMIGFGRLEFIRLDDRAREAAIRIYDSFECQLFPGAGEIRGNFIRGIIAGWLAGYWNLGEDEEAFAREVKCIAKGDPYCEYIVYVEIKRR
ncbi:MAG: hypothetical protein QW291_01255 [Thermofilaceae archaeon]